MHINELCVCLLIVYYRVSSMITAEVIDELYVLLHFST